MSASPRVSVIVPSYNAERFLRAALDSALAQEGVALEVLVADDGSTDGTSALLAEYGDRIRVLRQDHRGPAAAVRHMSTCVPSPHPRPRCSRRQTPTTSPAIPE